MPTKKVPAWQLEVRNEHKLIINEGMRQKKGLSWVAKIVGFFPLSSDRMAGYARAVMVALNQVNLRGSGTSGGCISSSETTLSGQGAGGEMGYESASWLLPAEGWDRDDGIRTAQYHIVAVQT